MLGSLPSAVTRVDAGTFVSLGTIALAPHVPYAPHTTGHVTPFRDKLQVEWMAWQREKQSVLHHGAAGAVLPQSLCQLPFLMTPECKKVILQGEAMLLQNHEVQNSLDRAMALMSRGTVRAPPPRHASRSPHTFHLQCGAAIPNKSVNKASERASRAAQSMSPQGGVHRPRCTRPPRLVARLGDHKTCP